MKGPATMTLELKVFELLPNNRQRHPLVPGLGLGTHLLAGSACRFAKHSCFACIVMRGRASWANFGVRPNAVALFVEIRRKFGDYFSCDRQKNSLAFQRSFLHGTRQSR